MGSWRSCIQSAPWGELGLQEEDIKKGGKGLREVALSSGEEEALRHLWSSDPHKQSQDQEVQTGTQSLLQADRVTPLSD